MTERVLSQVVEFDLDRCANTYGVSPCTAGRVESGTAQAGSSTTLTLRAGASAVDDAYKNMTARLTDGTAREGRISGYVGSTKVATISPRWPINLLPYSVPDNTNWSAHTTDGVPNFGVAPDGTISTYKTASSSPARYKGGAVIASLTYTYSIYVKAAASDAIRIYLDGAIGPASGFGSAAALFANPSAAPTLSGLATGASIELGASGFYRVQLQWAPQSNATANCFVYPATANQQEWWGAQLNLGSSADPYKGTNGSAINLPDATTTYDIIDRANACYNVFAGRSPCQSKANYVKGTQTLRFTGVGSPIDKTAPARPYISRIQRAVTELDPEAGLANRSASSVTMVDESCADVDLDPYILDRAAAATGTYWTRFLARNTNYPGRWARIKQGYVDHGTFGAYLTENLIIDKIAGPSGSGEVTITLKDPVKLADRSTTPTPTSGKLAADLGISDLTFTLGAGDGAQYAASGWVRINDEVIRYSSKAGDVFTLALSSYRAQFDTAAATAKAGDGVQQCTVWQDVGWSTVVQALLNNAGIVDSYIDLAGIQEQDRTWLGLDYRVTRCLSDPQDNSALLADLLNSAQAMGWWDPEAQKFKVQVFAPQSPGIASAKTLDELAYLIDRSVATERLDDLRISLAAVYFGLRTPVINVDEAKNYKFGELTIDADAESANEYNERRVQTFYVPWFGSANILGMRTHSRRYVARHRDAPENITFDLDVKDNDLQIGQVVDVQAKNMVDAKGATRTVRVLVTRKENTGTGVKFKARVTNFDARYGFIAPALTPDYPNNNGYACISDASGLMSDGTKGYLII